MLKLPISFKDFCNFKNDVTFLPHDTPPFYRQLLTFWYELYCKEPQNATDMMAEYIWHNKSIIIGQKTLFNIDAYKNGLNHVHDLFNNGKFIDLDTFNKTFELNWHVMQFNSLKDAIPVSWKRSAKDAHNKNMSNDLKIYIDHIKTDFNKVENKEVYWEFVRSIKVQPTAVIKWENLYDLTHFEWEDIFCIANTCARDTKLQSLQYQIIHRFFPCNATLHNWYADHNENCEYCDELDTLEHYFYNCEIAQNFWNLFHQWWCEVTNVNMNPALLDIIFGVTNHQGDILIDCLNYCILLGKWFIYNQKKNNKECHIFEYLKLLKMRLEIEQYLCNQKCQPDLFVEKWLTIFEWFF